MAVVQATPGQGVAVVGVGAIGGAVAAAVDDAATHELIACVRTPIDAVTVTRWDGPRTLDATIVAAPGVTPHGVDWVLLATKAYQTDGAKPWLDALCGPETRVAVLQNGITHVERVQPLVPDSRVVPVIVHLPAEKVGPGEIRQSRPGTLVVPDDADGAAFAELLSASETEVRLVADFTTALWRKLVTNASVGAIALTRQRNRVASEPAMIDALAGLLREAIDVGRAEGAVLRDELIDETVELLASVGDHLSSITNDLVAGQPLEWEVRNEIICRVGAKHGIPTPRHDLLCALLQASSGKPAVTPAASPRTGSG